MPSNHKKMHTFFLAILIPLSTAVLSGCAHDEEGSTDEGTDTESGSQPGHGDDFEMEVNSTVFKEEYKDVPTGLSAQSILGTWLLKKDASEYEEALIFNNDDTVMSKWSYGTDIEHLEGSWSVEGHLLSQDFYEDSYEDDDEKLSWHKLISSSAIVDNTLYLDVLVKVSDGANGIDGSWAYFVRKLEEWEEDGETASYDEYGTMVLEISGETLSIVHETRLYDHESILGGYKDEKVEKSGTVRTDGNEVYYTFDEMKEGEPFVCQIWNWIGSNSLGKISIKLVGYDDPPDVDTGCLLGYLVSDNIIVLTGDEEPLQNNAYMKQE
jgi:hypothetical protein